MLRVAFLLLLLSVFAPGQCLWGPTSASMQGWGLWDVCSGDLGNGVEIFAGGTFSSLGTVPADNIARWDGAQWWPLGAGIPQAIVRRLLIFDDGSGPALYA